MPLCVIGHMDQQSGNCRGHLLAANAARRCESVNRKRSYPGARSLERGVEFREYFFARRAWFQFRLHQRDLLRRKAAPFCIRQQTVAASRDVPNVECHWGDAAWASIELFITEIATPALDIFFGEFERMQHGPLYGGHVGQRPA